MSSIGPKNPFIPPNSENLPANKKQAKTSKILPQEQNSAPSTKLKQVLQPLQNQKAELKKSAEKIKNLESPLLPKKDATGSNVYPLTLESTNPHAVFKPGKSNTMKAILCAKVAKMLDLRDSIPKTIEATASHVISKGDLDDKGEAIIYERALINDKEYLVNPNDCFDIRFVEERADGGCRVKLANNLCLKLTKDGDGYVAHLEREEEDASVDDEKAPFDRQRNDDLMSEDEASGLEVVFNERAEDVSDDERDFMSFDVQRNVNSIDDEESIDAEDAGRGEDSQSDISDEELAQDDEEDFNPEDFDGQRVLFANDREILVFEEGAHLLQEDDEGEYVQRGEARFVLHDSEDEEGGHTLIGRDVEGFIQDWIPDVVTEINGNTVDTLVPSKTRDAFFSMIDTKSFMESLLLAMLFRTQDGKASNLEDTNFLFIKSDDHLQLKLIDLDETWPTTNDLTDDPVLAKKGAICALQLGLMGYPQAHMQLDGDEKAHVVALLQKIEQNRDGMLAALDKYQVDSSRTDQVKRAFNEVLDGFRSFNTDQPFTLANLVFHVFPEYRKQWDALESLGLPREEIAKWVGKATVEEVIALRQRKK